MQFNGSIPIYMQIIRYIKKQIIKGELKSEDKIPSVRDLADTLSVNPNTVSRAYQELEREGLTETQRGMGTYIVGDDKMKESLKKEISETLIFDFIKEMKDSGFSDKEIINSIKDVLEKGAM